MAFRIFTDFLDSDVFAVDPNLRTPYIQNYNFNIQRELFRNGVLEVGYASRQRLATGRGTGFLPITVTPDVGIATCFSAVAGREIFNLALKLIF